MNLNQSLRIEPDALSDMLAKIKRFFSVTFSEDELGQIKTYAQLYGSIIRKIEEAKEQDQVIQKTFFSLKEAVVKVTHMNEEQITPDTSLASVFPLKKRRYSVKKLEKILGFELNILTPKRHLIIALSILMLCSFFAFFVSRAYGFLGLLVSLSGLFLASRFGNQFTLRTLKELSEKIVTEHYSATRRWGRTISKNELDRQIESLFHNYQVIQKKESATL